MAPNPEYITVAPPFIAIEKSTAQRMASRAKRLEDALRKIVGNGGVSAVAIAKKALEAGE